MPVGMKTKGSEIISQAGVKSHFCSVYVAFEQSGQLKPIFTDVEA